MTEVAYDALHFTVDVSLHSPLYCESTEGVPEGLRYQQYSYHFQEHSRLRQFQIESREL